MKEYKALAMLIAELIVMVAAVVGFTLPIGETEIYAVVAIIVMLFDIAWAAWKNHNFSNLAKGLQTIKDSYEDDIEIQQGVESLLDMVASKADTKVGGTD